jgi:membrane protein YdbS with pleckstrin-like domain
MVGQIERFHPNVPKELDRYLIPTEQIIFLIRRHWVVLFEPIASVIAGLIVVGFLDSQLSGSALVIRDAAILLWLLILLRALWKWFEWYRELFLATDRRVMLVHGIITRKVDIMPMSKVTDMRYDRSLTGQLLGYGVYILESAGQDQALSIVKFIPNPDQHYQEISAVIFAPSQRRLSDKLVPASTGSKIPISEPEQAWWRRS